MKPFPIFFRRGENIDFQSLCRDLHDAIPWTPGSIVSNPEEGSQCWAQAVIPIFDRYVTVPLKHKSGFGITAATRHLIRLTTAQVRISRGTNAQSDIALYKDMRRQVKKAFCLERRKKHESSINSHRSSKDTWNLISATLGKGKVAHLWVGTRHVHLMFLWKSEPPL